MILLVGATGTLGGLIADKLLSRKHALRVMVRSDAAFDDFRRKGAEPKTGDLTDRVSLMSACRGVDAVVTTANAVRRNKPDTIETVDIQGSCNLVDAAVKCGVNRFIYMSAYGASMNHPVPILAAKAYVAAYVRSSSLRSVILEPNLFMDVWVEAIVGRPVREGKAVVLAGSARRRHSMVAANDVAEITTRVITARSTESETLAIGGPAALSWLDVVAAYERVTGRAITVRVDPSLPGMPEHLALMLHRLETFDSAIDMGATIARYGLSLTDLESYVSQTLCAAPSMSAPDHVSETMEV